MSIIGKLYKTVNKFHLMASTRAMQGRTVRAQAIVFKKPFFLLTVTKKSHRMVSSEGWKHQMEQLVIFLFPALCALFCCGASVVCVLNAKKPASVELQSHVDELTALVEKMMREARKEKMSRVRQAQLPIEGAPQPLPSTSMQMQNVGSVAERKARLRAMAQQRQHGGINHVPAQ